MYLSHLRLGRLGRPSPSLARIRPPPRQTTPPPRPQREGGSWPACTGEEVVNLVDLVR